MPASNCKLGANLRNNNSPAPSPPLGRPFFAIALTGRWAFILSIVTGLSAGLAIVPVSDHELGAALVTCGAFCIAAFAARSALKMQNRVEELEQKLLDERSYHAFVDSAAEGFFRTTRDGRYLIVNPALARIYGYNSPEHLITELTDIAGSLYVDSDRRKEFQIGITQNGTVHNFVSQIRRRDGSLIWISENARTVRDEDEQFLFYEGTVEDITTQMESIDAMRKALRETEEAARAKAAFLAAMSHELKTPLNAVIGFSDLMAQEIFGPVEPARYATYIADIHDNGRRLLALVNNILDLSRIEGRLMTLEECDVLIGDLAVAARDSAIAGKRDIAPIEIDIPGTLPVLFADPQRVLQALSHILSNAGKFTPESGNIQLRASFDADGGITIAISDTGIGMAPEAIRYAMEPFKQLDGRLARRFEGAGLGLPLASALMRLHGGRLFVESKPGLGTTVTMAFPPERTAQRIHAKSA
jgi:PAS domain S-box-containing protein